MQAFLALFPNRFGSAVRSSWNGQWRAVSNYFALSDEDLEAALEQSSKTLRALQSAEKTRFGVIKIEVDDAFRSPKGLAALRTALSSLRLDRTCLYKDGAQVWYLFAFFKAPIDATAVQRLFVAALKKSEIEKAVLPATYPGTMLLPLPLQQGFVWLNDDGDQTLAREDLGTLEAIKKFLSDLDIYANDIPEKISTEEAIVTEITLPPLVSGAAVDAVRSVQTEASTEPESVLSLVPRAPSTENIDLSGQVTGLPDKSPEEPSNGVQLSMQLALPPTPIAPPAKVLPMEPHKRSKRASKGQSHNNASSSKEVLSGSPKTEDTS